MVIQRSGSLLLLILAYIALAVVAQVTLAQPGYGAPIWPAAGLALAALLHLGWRAWPSVWLGAFLFCVGLDYWLLGHVSLAVPAVMAMGIAGQTVLGARLTRRYLDRPAPLAHTREVAGFLILGGPVACLLAASVAVPVLYLTGRLPGQDCGSTWLSWYVGDSLGVLLGTPLLLAFFPAWRERSGNRFLPVAVPLLITGGLLLAALSRLHTSEELAAQANARSAMRRVVDSAIQQLPANLEALYGLERFFAASEEVSRAEFAQFTGRLVRHPGVQAVQWAPRLHRDGRAEFEEHLRWEGFGDLRLTELLPDGRLQVAAERPEYYPVLFVEPLATNLAVLGYDHATRPRRRQAMAAAVAADQAQATDPARLVPTGEIGIPVFLPVYQAGFAAGAATREARQAALRGFVVILLDAAGLFGPMAQEAARQHFGVQVEDLSDGALARPLYGTPRQPSTPQPHHLRDLEFAGRQWQICLYPLAPVWQAGRSQQHAYFLGFALVAAFLVSLTTLASVGREAAIGHEVALRTAELANELAARQAGQAALHASEQRLAITLDSIGDAVLATDTAGRVTRLNPVAERLTGWSQAEALGRGVAEIFVIINEQDRHPVVIPVAKVLATGQVQGLGNHTILIARGGMETCIADSAAPIRDHQGQVLGVVLVFRDVSQERAAERALTESEARHRRFVEQTPIGVLVEREARFAYLNPAALRLFGAAHAADLLGQPVLSRLHPEEHGAVHVRLRQLNDDRQAVPVREARFIRLDGSIFHGEASAVPYEYEGRACGLVMLQDISARKAAESERDRFFAICPDLFCILDAQGRFIRLNPAGEKLLGWNDVSVAQQRLPDLIHPDDQAEFEAHLTAALAQGSSGQLRVRGRHHDGTWQWLSWLMIREPESGLIYATGRLVNELVQAEQAMRDFSQALEVQVVERTVALAESERFNRATLDALSAMVAVLDERGMIVAANAGWHGYHGRVSPQARYWQIGGDFLAECERQAAGGQAAGAALAARLRAIIAGELLSDGLEYAAPDHAGQEHWFQCRFSRFTGAGPRRVVMTHEDISGVKQAQAELVRTQKRFADLFEFAPDAMIMTDTAGRITLVNKQAETLFGWTRQELLGQPMSTLLPEESQPKPGQIAQRLQQASTQRVLSSGHSGLRGRRKDGSTFRLDLSHSPLHTGDGPQIATAARDITKRLEAENQMRLALATLDATADAALIFDPETLRFFYGNEGAAKQLGYARGALLELTPMAIMPEYSEAKFRELLAPLAQGELQTRRLTTTHRRQNGQELPVEIHLQYLAPPEERPRFIAIARDISERVRMERQANRNQRMEAIGTLAGGVAHDLNNALAPIMVAAELLRMKYPSDARIVDMIATSAQRGADMVRQLLSFAKGAEGKRVSVQLSHLVRELENIMKSTFPKNLRLEILWRKDLPTVLGDATQLHQVLLNLCVNARDAMPEGGSLTVAAASKVVDATFASGIDGATPGRFVTLTVRDTGTGIAAEILDRIFDPFFTTKGPEKGTGLGLSTVMGIVKGHGGFLQVCSQVGKGTEFTVYLPAEDQDASAAEPSAMPAPWLGHGELVLVVDDEPGVREVASAVLETLGLRVICAADGTEGLMRVAEQRERLRVIITDLHMPHMDGLGFAQAARRMLPKVPVIVASGRFEEHLAEAFREVGVTLRLNKPFTQEMLAEILKAALTPPADAS